MSFRGEGNLKEEIDEAGNFIDAKWSSPESMKEMFESRQGVKICVRLWMYRAL